MLLSVDMGSYTYRFDICRIISKVYYSKHREVFREFNGLSEFEDCFFEQQLSLVNDQLHTYFSRGYNYLEQQEREGFVEFTFDDENINFHHVGFSEVKRYLMSNAMAHLYAAIALKLMDDTDIEDHLSSGLRLTHMTPWYMTFSYRTY